MLPFDNKNEFQLVVDMPETATLETTDAVVRDLERFLATQPEVTVFTSLVGAATPMDFNGMVRHYYLRRGPAVADIRVNLLHRSQRAMDSHAVVLRIREEIEQIARHHAASIKVVEVPPGPPVLSTVVAELYGRPHHDYEELVAAADTVRERFAQEPGVVDVDVSAEALQQEFYFRVDRDKAALSGVSVGDVVETLRAALSGLPTGLAHLPGEQNELPLVLRLPREQRSSLALLRALEVKGRFGTSVQIGELGTFVEGVHDRSLLHKNQRRVVYVTGEMAGRGPAYAVLAMQSHFAKHPLPAGLRIDWRGEGEWKITVDVFRDLGLAFAAALVGIYVLLVYETGSFALPVVIMLSIPLSLIGIMPGFWLLNALVNRPVGGYENPVFFTATAMIGMIALSGIVVRNGIILIDFIRAGTAKGQSLPESILASGAVRFRPIFLTACTTVLGAWPITLDPIFSGLAWAIIFGMFVSTTFTLVVIPTVYHLMHGKSR
jgi:multidrug efflux pump subunit AcrB